MMKISIRWKCVALVAAVTELLVKMERTKVKKIKEEIQQEKKENVLTQMFSLMGQSLVTVMVMAAMGTMDSQIGVEATTTVNSFLEKCAAFVAVAIEK